VSENKRTEQLECQIAWLWYVIDSLTPHHGINTYNTQRGMFENAIQQCEEGDYPPLRLFPKQASRNNPPKTVNEHIDGM